MLLEGGFFVSAAAPVFSNYQPTVLADLPVRQAAVVTMVVSSDHAGDAAMLRRLAEIGFLPGEPVKVLARIAGGDPLAVRIGNSTFALRRCEALCVQVQTGVRQ